MARFEVFIPAAEPGSFDVTLRVDAANWMQALKTGFHRLGEQGLVPHNVMVDVQDDGSVHVTDANSARVFRIREMSEAEIAAGKLKPRPTPMGTPVAVEPVVPPPSPAMVDPVAQTLGPDAPLVGVAREVKDPHVTSGMDVPPGGLESHGDAGAGPADLTHRSAADADEHAARHPSASRRAGLDGEAAAGAHRAAEAGPVSGRADGRRARRGVRAGAGRLPAARRGGRARVPAGSGDGEDSGRGRQRVLQRARLGRSAVRGGAGTEGAGILEARIVIPAGTGIVGFCAVEGVSLALSDVQKDTRYYRGVSDRVHYETRSILCSPVIAHGRTFGCMELVNRRESPVFTEYEVGILSYIAHQGALFLDTLG